MKFAIGDRVKFGKYTGTVIDIEESGEYWYGYEIDWDVEYFDSSLVAPEQIEMIESFCENHKTRKLYSKSEDEYICPFC